MDVIAKKRTRLSPEDRRRQLLDKGISIFARDGINRAGHASIAEIADVSIATVFNYFPTREDLVYRVLEDVRDHFYDFISSIFTENEQPSLKKQLEVTFQTMTEVFYKKEHTWPNVWYEWSTCSRDDVLEQYCQSRTKVKDLLIDLCDKYQVTDPKQQRFIVNTFVAISYSIYHQSSTGISREESEYFTHTFLSNSGIK